MHVAPFRQGELWHSSMSVKNSVYNLELNLVVVKSDVTHVNMMYTFDNVKVTLWNAMFIHLNS